MSVTKKDGTTAKFDISKVKKVISWACEGLDVNQYELESHIDVIFTSGISTSKIQDNLVQQAVKLTTFKAPDWRFVAGRLVLMPRWKHNLGIKSFPRFIESKVNSGEYVDSLFSEYTDQELEFLGESIVNSRDLDYDYAGANILCKRYLLDGESPQIALMSISALLALPEHPSDRIDTALRFYEALSLRKISLATPLLMNLRRPGGNLASCFVTTMQDTLGKEGDNIGSITDIWEDVARISQNGGGVGISMSNLRAKGSSIRGYHGAASGVVPCIKVLNDIAVYINQLNARVGAFTTALAVWHADVESFLDMQSETGDLRSKSYDVFPQLVVCDYFMGRLKADEDWYTFDPYEVKLELGFDLPNLYGHDLTDALKACSVAVDMGVLKNYKVLRCRDIIKKVIKMYLETGLPYITFLDTWNKVNPNKHTGMIPCSNLCVESSSNVSMDETHVCNLVSIVLANIELDELPAVSKLCVHLLDNAIELSVPPIKKANTHNNNYRVIGVGVMGLADSIAKHNLSYLHADVGSFISNIFETISYNTIKKSIELASHRGAYDKFSGSDWDTGARISTLSYYSSDHDKWDALQDEIDKYGIRNSQLMAVAPNTSSSLIMGCSASILPVYKHFFIDNAGKGAVPVAAKYLVDHMWGYTEYKHMDHFKMNSLISTMQKWVDTGISYELLFDLNRDEIDAKYIYDVIVDAWEKGIKSLYYARTITDTGLTSDKEECISCAG